MIAWTIGALAGAAAVVAYARYEDRQPPHMQTDQFILGASWCFALPCVAVAKGIGWLFGVPS